MKEKIKNSILLIFNFISRKINYPIIVFLAIAARLVFFRTPYWGEGLALALIFIATTGFMAWNLHLNRQEDKWRMIVDKELREIKDFVAQFKLSKNLRDQADERKRQNSRYF